MLTVGIDLGTTATVIAVIGEDGEPVVIPADGGKTSTPSVVNYANVDCFKADQQNQKYSATSFLGLGGDTVAVGREALLKMDRSHTVFSVKRSMGTSQKFFQKTPEEISAEILAYVKRNVEQKLGDVIGNAVITVPAHFSDIQRTATKRAASLAGIKVLRLINEPTAAALAFGLTKKVNGVYAVYDFGGGTFDFSVLRLSDGIFQVLATGGDNYLGGDDVDRALLRYNLKRCGIDETTLLESDEMRARLVVKNMKEQIGGNKTAAKNEKGVQSSEKIQKKCVISGLEYTFEISAELLKELSAPYLEKTFAVADQVLSDARVSSQELDGVLMVGGMTKLRLIKDAVRDHFCATIFDSVDPEEVVAFGAAIQANNIVNKSGGILLVDVVPLTLGIETFGGGVDKIIHRNTPIPVSEVREYTTYADNQNAIKFRVVQGERALAKDCRSIATFELTGIPLAPRGVPHIAVKFSVDVNGILSVSAREQNTGLEQSIIVEPSAGLSEDMMVSMLEGAMKNAAQDREKSAYLNARMNAERQAAFWESIYEDIPDASARVDVKNKLKDLRKLLSLSPQEEASSISVATSDDGDSIVQKIQKIREYTESMEAIIDRFIDGIISERLSKRPVKIA